MPTSSGARTAGALALLAAVSAVPAHGAVAAQSAPGEADSGGGLDSVPATRPPRLVNPDEVADALDRHYPEELRQQRISGVTVLEMKVDRIGLPYEVTVADSAGHPWFDEAALEVAEAMEFKPGTRHGEPAEYTVEIPLRFQVSLPPGLRDVHSRAACREGPRMANANEMLEELKRTARRNNLAGNFEAHVTMTIDAGGTVRNVELESSSGSRLFDQVALAIGSFLRFEPCVRDGVPRPSQVTIPVRLGVE